METWTPVQPSDWTIADLKHHWGGAYVIYRSLSHCSARRRDEPEVVLTAGTPGELVTLVRLDYQRQPVPR